MVQYFQLEEADAKEHHKKCYICKGSQETCFEIVRCSSEKCNKFCHVDCMAEDIREKLDDEEDYFCTEACEQAFNKKQKFSVTKLLAEVERLKLENAEATKTSLKALQSVDTLSKELGKSQDVNRSLIAQNQNLSLLASTRRSGEGSSFYGSATDESLFNISVLQKSVQKSVDSVQNTISANATGIPSTSDESIDPLAGRKFDEENSATAEHAKASFYLSLREIRKNLGELPEFDGKGSAWLKFKTRYAKIKEVGQFTEAAMVEKLEKALKGKALDFVRTWIDSPSPSAVKIMSDLEERFFNPDTIMQEGLNNIIQFEQIKTWNREQLEDFARLIDTYIQLCITVDYSIHLNGRLPGGVEDKLPDDLLREWMKHKSTSVATGSWFEFSVFVKNSLKYLKVRASDVRAKDAKTKSPVPKVTAFVDNSSGSSLTPAKKDQRNNKSKEQKQDGEKKFKPVECVYDQCTKPLYLCEAFQKRKHDVKLKFCKDFDICTKCLIKGHTAMYCRRKFLKCKVEGCQDPLSHTKVMHPNSTTTQSNHINRKNAFSLFQVVPVKISDVYGRLHDVTVFIDTGSNSSLMTHELYAKLGLEGTPHNFNIEWCAAGVKQKSTGSFKTRLSIFAQHNPDEELILENIVSMSNLQLPKQSQDANEIKKIFPHLADVNIPHFESQRPQILLGLPHRHLTFSSSTILPPKDEIPIIAEQTPLGWAVSVVHEPGEYVNFLTNASEEVEDDSEITLKQLHDLVKSHIDMDSTQNFLTFNDLPTIEDKRALIVQEKTMKLVGNRYEVGFYWKTDDVVLPDNYTTAEKRLKSSEAALRKKNLVEWAVQHHEQLIELGFAREASEEDLFPVIPHKRINYVIGFAVVNQNKIPPKPRWVVDTACTHNGISLNSALLKGPDNLVPLPQALFHFRERKIAVVADVEKMFHQMMVNKVDQQCQRYLWRDCDTSKPPKIYIYNVMLFGPTDSPSKANAVRILHATNNSENFPNASRASIDSMYMDDWFNSEDEIHEAVETANQAINMFKAISWKLVDFRTNSSELLTQLPKEHVNQNVMVELFSDDPLMAIHKVLGIHWKPKQDFFNFQQTAELELLKKSINENYRPSKREILSFIMRIYDCLGLISHFIVRGRMILQSVWKEKFEWDTPISDEIFNSWVTWLKKFDEISRLEIPRHYGYHSKKVIRTTLHVFTDASLDAYCAVCYFRFEFNDGHIQTCLVLSKARVAPLKYLSVPKLELKGASVGLQLARVIQDQHKRLKIAAVTFWTDSEIVLKWIRGVHLKLQPFVAPRVSEIREFSKINEWRHVPTKMNPADDGTKWNEIDFSSNKHRWFVGPDFLSQNEIFWPKDKNMPIETAEAVYNLNKISLKDLFYAGVFMEVNSSVRADWNRYRLTIAHVIRFCDNCLTEINGGEKNYSSFVSVDELNEAEILIFREIQKSYWPNEYGNLSRGRRLVKNNSHSLHSLSPFMGPHGLLRSRTRMSHHDVSFDMKFPIILPNKHETVHAIVRHYHIKNHHIGVESVVANLRSRFWIIHTRNAVKRISATCVYCIGMRSKPYCTPTAPMPEIRVTSTTKAFEFVGCDCFGPMEVYTRNSKRKRTVNVVIFTCLTSRAIYLCRLDSMTTDEMLLAIQELWTRRGPVKIIMSDNGKNFTGSANFLNREFLQRVATDFNLKWIFNPPYTPQWGGAWERLIRDIKRALKAATHGKIIPEKEFDVILLQIEDILNCRPLTHVSASPDDEFPITPNLLVKLHPGYSLVENDLQPTQEEKDLRRIVKKSRNIVQQFTKRWLKEYLPIITRAPANGKGKQTIKEGDYVIYCDPTINPSKWQRGIVKTAHAGRDGIARVADIQLKTGEILTKRSAYRLAKLDIDNSAFTPDWNKVSLDEQELHTMLTAFLYRDAKLTDNASRAEKKDATAVPSFSSITRVDDEENNQAHVQKQDLERSTMSSQKVPQLKAIELLKQLRMAKFINASVIKSRLRDNWVRNVSESFQSVLYQDPSNQYSIKIESSSSGLSFADIIVTLASVGVQPMRVFIDDISRRPPIVAFIILAHQAEANRLIEDGTLTLSVGTVQISRPKQSRDLPSASVKHEHGFIRWTPFDIEFKVLLVRRANDDREIRLKGFPIRAAFPLGAIWQQRLDEFMNESGNPWSDDRVEDQPHAEPSVPPLQRAVRKENKRLIVEVRGDNVNSEATTSAKAAEAATSETTEVVETNKPKKTIIRLINSSNASRNQRETYTDSDDSD